MFHKRHVIENAVKGHKGKLLQAVTDALLQEFPGAKIVQKSESQFMKTLAKAGSAVGIFKSYEDFMGHHSTTIGKTVYVNFDPDKMRSPEAQFAAACVIAHEFVHVRQYLNDRIMFQINYLTVPSERMWFEGNAYVANLGLELWEDLLELDHRLHSGLISIARIRSEISKLHYGVLNYKTGEDFLTRLCSVYRVKCKDAELARSIVRVKLLSMLQLFAEAYNARSENVLSMLPREAQIVAQKVLEGLSLNSGSVLEDHGGNQ